MNKELTLTVGNDGLTNEQRDSYANDYRNGAGRQMLSDAERRAFTAWLQRRRPAFDEEGSWMLTDAEHVGEDV